MPEELVDRYADMVLHSDLFDWSDPTLTPDSITTEILGDHSYWDDDEDFVHLNGRRMSPMEIERQILFDAGRDQWHQKGHYGKPYYKHFLSLMKLMFVDTDITTTIADATMVFCLSLGHRKLMNLIGCQSSSKSASASRIMFVAMYIDPDYTVGYVATPFDSASSSSAWGDCLELWDELCTAHPLPSDNNVPSMFPKGKKYANRKLTFKPNVPKAGSIELRNIKHTGKLKGSKTRGKITDRGIMFMNIDEINEIENMSFLNTIENIASQKAFFAITTQNYKSVDDLGGIVTTPVAIFPNSPSSFEDLDMERDLFWYSAKSSVTLRFDGHRSPNVLAKRTIYPYLIDQKDLDRLRESGGGEESLIYASQARSFPIRGGENNSVLSHSKLSVSRHKDINYQMLRTRGSVSFCDPAFGGRDTAVWGCAHFGDATVLDGDGRPYDQELLVFNDHMKKLKIVNDAYYNEYWFQRMKDCGMVTADFPEGSLVGPEDQVAIQCRELNLAAGVPAKNFGFDFSMRPDIVSSMNKIVGFDAKAMSYNHKPHGYFLENTKQNTEDCCKNMNTEMALMAADVVLTKQLRGGALIETALIQTNRTYVEMVNNKYLTEDKRTYKARWQNKSPDERDTFFGIVKMALDNGFRRGSVKSSVHDSSAWEEINRRGLGKARVTSKI